MSLMAIFRQLPARYLQNGNGAQSNSCLLYTSVTYGAAVRRLAGGYEADPERRRDLLPVSYTHLDVYKRQS